MSEPLKKYLADATYASWQVRNANVYLAADVDALLRQREEEVDRLSKEIEANTHKPTVTYWMNMFTQMQQEAKKRFDDWFTVAEERDDLRAQLASMTAERDVIGIQIDNLASFIMTNVPGEPSQSQGAGETAMRIIATLQKQLAAALARCAELENNYSKLFNTTLGYIGQVSANATIRNSGLADLITDIQALTTERPPA